MSKYTKVFKDISDEVETNPYLEYTKIMDYKAAIAGIKKNLKKKEYLDINIKAVEEGVNFVRRNYSKKNEKKNIYYFSTYPCLLARPVVCYNPGTRGINKNEFILFFCRSILLLLIIFGILI